MTAPPDVTASDEMTASRGTHRNTHIYLLKKKSLIQIHTAVQTVWVIFSTYCIFNMKYQPGAVPAVYAPIRAVPVLAKAATLVSA